MTDAITLDDDQLRWARARNNLLTDQRAATLEDAARHIVGAQAQVFEPAAWGLALRTEGGPTRSHVLALLAGADAKGSSGGRRLVRTWGQRDTLHIYVPDDWSSVVAARAAWPKSGRRGVMPQPADLDGCLRRLRERGAPFLRDDLFDLVPPDVLCFFEDTLPDNAKPQALRYAAGRVIWCLAAQGHLCSAGKLGSKQLYALRSDWFANLPWPAREVDQTNVGLVRRYLAAFGPATPQDVAHYLGANVTRARGWLGTLRDTHELVDVSCGQRKGLVALVTSAGDLTSEPPPGQGWPLRLIPSYDTVLMGHADKSAICLASEEKAVWRKAAHVMAVVLHRGQIVATWTRKTTKKKLTVIVEPLSRYDATTHRRGIESEAERLRAHLELPELKLDIS